MFLPLKDLFVLDLTSDICGPYATKLFADAGADVLKIESPDGDTMRGRTFFQFLNTSKKSLVLDLEKPEDSDRLAELAAVADLLVEDYPAAKMEELGISPKTLREKNPELVVLSISPWGKNEGKNDPFATFPANEFTLQSWAGSIFHKGVPGEMPFGVGGQLGDFMTGSAAAMAGLGAVMSAKKTGQGSCVDVSKFEAIATSFVTYHHIMSAFDPSGERTAGRSIEIPSIEPTSDGWVGFCTITGQQYQDFCVLIGDKEMAEDERFLNFDQRMENKDEAWQRISAYTSKHTTDEVLEQASLLRIPVSPISNGESVLSVPHFLERNIYVKNPAGFSQPRIPFLFEKGKMRDFEPAPELAEMGELGGLGEAEGEKGKLEEKADNKKNGGNEKKRKKGSESREGQAGQSGVAKVLEGIRVCDLSAFWAGPLVGSILAAFGADVIKVESHKRPDGMRFAGSMSQETMWEWGPVFHGANTGKRELTLDVLSDEGRVLLEKLVAVSDVVLENYSPRVMENWGLTWETVKKLNPRAIMVRMPAFGLTGPWRDRTGFAMTIEQASGLAFRTGDPDGRPMVPRGVCDPMGSMHAAYALLLALKDREETGKPQLVEVPLVEVGLNAAAEQVVEWSANKNLLQRMGNRSMEAAPQGVYPCLEEGQEEKGQDSWVCISMDKDELWENLVNLITPKDDAHKLKDKSLKNLPARIKAHDQIDVAITAWSKTLTADEAVGALTDLGIPAAPVIPGAASLDHPQHLARRFHQRMNHPVAGEVPYISHPFQVDGEFLDLKRPAPTLGQHSAEILQEVLGLTAEETAAMEEKGIIGTVPNFG